jgi:hypothetical protein
MPNSVITFVAGNYAINGSKRVHAELTFNFLDGTFNNNVSIQITPIPVAPVTITLEHPPTIVNITGGVSPVSSGGRTVTFSTFDNAGTRTYEINVVAPGGGPPAEAWVLKISGLAGAGTNVTVQASEFAQLTAAEADPFIETVPPPVNPSEGSLVTLQAKGRRNRMQGSALPNPAVCAEVTFNWTYDDSSPTLIIPATMAAGATPLSDGSAGCLGQVAFTLTGINEAVNLHFTCTATCGLFNNTTTAVVHAVTRQRYALLVLDRSGSMGGAKWNNAKAAAAIWFDIYAALRQGVNNGDRIGIEVFDDQLGYHADASGALHSGISNRIEVVFPTPAGSLKAIPALNQIPADLGLQPPGLNTPIADAVFRGFKRMLALPGPPGQTLYTVLFMTDGQENAGTMRIDNTPPVPAGIQLYNSVKTGELVPAGLNFTGLNKNVTFYSVGVGGPGTTDEEVLNDLASQNNNPLGLYHLVNDSADLFTSFGQMLVNDINAQAPAVSSTPMVGTTDPANPAANTAAYFVTPAGDAKLAVAVLLNAGQLELFQRDSGTSNGFAAPANAPTVLTRSTHIIAFLPLSSPGGKEWRVRVLQAGVPQSLVSPAPPHRSLVLAVRDLRLRTEIVFDRAKYSTGEPMKIEARIGAGNQPVTGATIVVELAMPGEGLGTYLATASQQMQVTTVPTVTKPVQGGSPTAGTLTTGAPLRPKEALFRFLLEKSGKTSLSVVNPAGFFVDGTNRLHDDGAHGDGPANNGCYANTFANTFKEGTYTFRFTVSGHAPDGSPFRDTFVISRWVGVNVDPLITTINLQTASSRFPTLQAAQVIVIPKDKRGEYLGPFRANDLRFSTTNGAFQGDIISHPDGSYSRLLYYPQGTTPQVKVYVQGKEVGRPTTPGKGCGCLALPILGPILERLARLLGFDPATS